MLSSTRERRRFGRIQLELPLAARFGESRVRVLELSLFGFLIAHEGRFQPGDTRHLGLEWNGAKIELVCRIARSTLYRLAKAMGERSLYHSGLHIVEAVGNSHLRLRELIGDRIIRALEEQKANARGIPPLAAYMYQPEKGELYRRCELIDGVWRKTETMHPDQPRNGFTVSAEVDPYHVEMLCQTWENTTAEGRRLTQMLAALSVDQAEGVPTRRYVP